MPLGKKLEKQIAAALSKMESPVELLLFTSGRYPKVEAEMEAALRDISSLSRKLSLKKYGLDSNEAKKEDVRRGPAIVLRGKAKGRIRFFGFPSGYQFPVFIMDIVDVSGAKGEVKREIAKKAMETPKTRTLLEVFEIPSCSYSPIAVKAAHDIAIFNPNVTADMVDILLFPELVRKYKIRETPTTVINGKAKIAGIMPLSKLLIALGK